MKKGLYIFACILEALLVAGSYVFNYFTKSKMGMARYVIFKNQSWLSKYPMEQWKLAGFFAVAALSVLAAVLFMKKRKQASAVMKADMAIMIALSCGYGGFTLFSSMDKLRAYYFISLMLGAAALIQIIKFVVEMYGDRNEK